MPRTKQSRSRRSSPSFREVPQELSCLPKVSGLGPKKLLLAWFGRRRLAA